jgi:hypothetical protein
MKTIKRTLLILITIFSISTINAQEEVPKEKEAQEIEEVKETGKKFTLSGSVDTYYQTNLSAPDDIDQSFGTSFANELGFALGMANVALAYNGKKTGAVIDLAFGPRGEAATGGYNINQLYVYYSVSDVTTFTLGRWNTYLGYEVISPVGNFNYSTSYLFSSGPFSNVGLKADFAFSEDFSLMLAVMNVTDVNNNLTGAYSAGAQLGYKGQYLNFYYDDGQALGFEIDYTGGFDITDSFYFGVNAAYADNDGNGFYGVDIYPQLTTSDSFAIGLRGEYFVQQIDGVSNDPNVFSVTLTGNYSVENLTIKPELRLDTWGDAMPYIGSDGLPSDNLSSFLIAAVYAF